MTGSKRIVCALGLAACAASLGALDRITLQDAVRSALAGSNLVEQADLRVQLSGLARESILEATRPAVTLSADPMYSVRTQRGSSFATITSIADFPPQTVSSSTHQSGLGLSLRQPLPSSGLLTASVATALSATYSRPDDGNLTSSYSLQPSISASLSQPLFVDGRFIDTELPRLALSAADTAVLAARMEGAATREQVALAVTRLFVQLGSFRRAAQIQREQQELVVLQLDEARVRLDQGAGARQQVTGLEIQRNRSRDIELQNQLAARELEIELSRLTGLEIGSGTGLDAGFDPDAMFATVSDRGSTTLSTEQARVAIENARIEYERSRRQEEASARVALSLTPRYADQRDAADTLLGAVTDYSGTGAGVDVFLSIGVDVPLGTSRARARAIEQATAGVVTAELRLQRVMSEEQSSRQILASRAATIRSRIELAEFDLAFETEQLVTDRELFDLGQYPLVDLARRELTVSSRRNDIDNLRSELLLTVIELARASGVDVVRFVTDSIPE